jgi:RES domain-containing protein
VIAWRVCRVAHRPYDSTGAQLYGARWNSVGRSVIYAADSFAGAILELLAHALRPRTLPGPHHAVQIEIPDAAIETLAAEQLPGWSVKGSPAARAFGDRWIAEGRTPVLVVPAVPSQPIGRTVLINTTHPQAGEIVVSQPFAVPWDERLF